MWKKIDGGTGVGVWVGHVDVIKTPNPFEMSWWVIDPTVKMPRNNYGKDH